MARFDPTDPTQMQAFMEQYQSMSPAEQEAFVNPFMGDYEGEKNIRTGQLARANQLRGTRTGRAPNKGRLETYVSPLAHLADAGTRFMGFQRAREAEAGLREAGAGQAAQEAVTRGVAHSDVLRRTRQARDDLATGRTEQTRQYDLTRDDRLAREALAQTNLQETRRIAGAKRGSPEVWVNDDGDEVVIQNTDSGPITTTGAPIDLDGYAPDPSSSSSNKWFVKPVKANGVNYLLHYDRNDNSYITTVAGERLEPDTAAKVMSEQTEGQLDFKQREAQRVGEAKNQLSWREGLQKTGSTRRNVRASLKNILKAVDEQATTGVLWNKMFTVKESTAALEKEIANLALMRLGDQSLTPVSDRDIQLLMDSIVNIRQGGPGVKREVEHLLKGLDRMQSVDYWIEGELAAGRTPTQKAVDERMYAGGFSFALPTGEDEGGGIPTAAAPAAAQQGRKTIGGVSYVQDADGNWFAE